LIIQLQDEQATVAIGAALAELLPKKGLVFLRGPLGAGKTTLVRGLLRALGHIGSTKSPTYTIVEPYELADGNVYHFDLYRIADPEELEYLGFRDYIADQSLCLIEWPEKGKDFLPQADMELNLAYEGEARTIQLKLNNPEWQRSINLSLVSEL
jgi:tRNA threonylcarbamoyladenosine biosynthesis protein TsaE